MILLFSQDDSAIKQASDDAAKFNMKEISDPFTAALRNKKKQNKAAKEKLNLYFQKGLREFREGNYFRAMNEFNHALSWSPNDPLANFYLRKTKEALSTQIGDFQTSAKRDEQSLNYQKALVSYCDIVRLLHAYPEDERYIDASSEIKKIETNPNIIYGTGAKLIVWSLQSFLPRLAMCQQDDHISSLGD